MARQITLKIQVLRDWTEWMRTTKGKTKGKDLTKK